LADLTTFLVAKTGVTERDVKFRVCHFEHLLNRVLFYNFGLAFQQKFSVDGLLPGSEGGKRINS
jgi:hypothetical protein